MGELAHKVRELDPGSRALLDLSVRRGLADVEIAGVLGTDATYVASTRTGVMQTIAADLQLGDAERAELEELLAQLPAEAWLPPGEPAANGTGNGTSPAVVAEPEEAEAEAEVQEPEAEVETRKSSEGEVAAEAEETHEPEPEAEPEPEVEAAPAGAGPKRAAGTLSGGTRKRRRTGAIVTSLLVAVLLIALVVLLATTGGDGGDEADEPAAPAQRDDAGRGGGGAGSQGQPLEALPGAGDARGTARLEGERLVVRISNLPGAARNYQVWLYDSLIDAEPLGRLHAGENGAFRGRFRAGDIGRFEYVDISREPRDGNSNHSGRSVMRIATSELR